MPDLRELRVFLAVAEHLSFTRAAEALHFTQQTVSKTVQALERELGVELLERTSREVHLTAAGKALVEAGPDVIARADAAFAYAREVGTGQAGTVRVGVSPAIGPQTRADVVRALRADADRAVSLHEIRPGELRQVLRDGTVDLALAVISGTESDTVDRAALRPAQMQVHMPADHPLAGREQAHLSDFDGARLLTASRAGTPFTDLLVQRFAAAGAHVTPVESRVTGGAQLLTELVDAQAIAALPLGTVSPPGVTSVSVPGFTVPLLVLWPAGLPSPAVKALRDALRP